MLIQIHKIEKLIENFLCKLKKFLFMHGQKMDVAQSGHRSLKLTVSKKWTDEIKWFLHVDTDSQKLKAD